MLIVTKKNMRSLSRTDILLLRVNRKIYITEKTINEHRFKALKFCYFKTKLFMLQFIPNSIPHPLFCTYN